MDESSVEIENRGRRVPVSVVAGQPFIEVVTLDNEGQPRPAKFGLHEIKELMDEIESMFLAR